MAKPRAMLDQELDALPDWIRGIQADPKQTDAVVVIGRRVNAILDEAWSDDVAHVRSRLEHILLACGIVPPRG